MLHELGWYLTCHTAPRTLWEDARGSPSTPLPARVHPHSHRAAWALRLGWGCRGAHPYLQSRGGGKKTIPTHSTGRNLLSPSVGIYTTTFHSAGLKDNHAQGSCLHSTDARSSPGPLLSRIVDITFPAGCEGMLMNWCSSVCFGFLAHVIETHLKTNRF